MIKREFTFIVSIILVLLTVLVFSGCTASADAGPTLSPAAALGKRIYSTYCAACHASSGETVIVGPSLAGISTRAGTRIEGYTAEEYIHESIIKPNAYLVDGYKDLMPADFGVKLSGEEFDGLVEYLFTLD
jgi:mono/diheme cytochrome c family protein